MNSVPNRTILDKTMSINRANLIAGILMVPAYFVATIPFYLLWGRMPAFPTTTTKQLLLLIPLFIVSIVLHELLHAIGYRLGGANRHQISFGFTQLSPYAHCKIPLALNSYRLAVALPGILLGVLPGIIGYLFAYDGLTLFSAIMLIAATGDAIILWMLRNAPSPAYVQDHPTLMGCQLLIQQNETKEIYE